MALRSVLRSTGKRFREDGRGVAGIEFGLVVSVLLLALLGLCDLVPSWMAYTHVSSAASTAADVTGQFSEMQTTDMVNVYSAAASVMSPFPSTGQSLRITNVFSDGNGHAKVYWSCGTGNLQPYNALSVVTTTPTGVSFASFLGTQASSVNTSYVVTEVSYTYAAPARFVLRSPLTLTGVSYYLPRRSAYVGFPWDGNVNDAPTAPATATNSSSVQLSNGATCNYGS